MKKEPHTVIRNSNIFCLNCGSEYKIKYPLPINEMTLKIDAFNLLHNDCEKTWVEPISDQSKDLTEKAMWWISNGEKGLSSETMWNCLIGNKDFRVNHPSDPDDFKRCYKLLQAVPEWKSELHKLKPLSNAWNNLIDNWDKLTTMYELNVKTEWKDYKSIGMYEFMKTLIN